MKVSFNAEDRQVTEALVATAASGSGEDGLRVTRSNRSKRRGLVAAQGNLPCDPQDVRWLHPAELLGWLSDQTLALIFGIASGGSVRKLLALRTVNKRLARVLAQQSVETDFEGSPLPNAVLLFKQLGVLQVAMSSCRTSFRTVRDALPRSVAALSRLDFEGQSIGTEGVCLLSDVLPHCAVVSFLNLSRNGIGAQGAGALREALPQCALLSHLDLSGNAIGAEGAGVLCRALPRCLALSFLDLSRNAIGALGARAVSEVLPRCPALSQLDLYGNGIGPEGAGALSQVLPHCVALSFLDLSRNDFG
eukprot:CAMPEP_0175993436 /NCGR_PEP_ID=MMETSP0108-20121206/53965_1 /TAXON_ID=195067 ORGANISM="Goniomonas pacifica, Strain CCMP1869" /NCGR_SAMPLE_ID=MMETSP0108 /ASSEMBLY_ACC=CAM_ASM_000204 /LENGTH=305 /DNA_ID=CAMNT_0017325227 /DNA_START=19 /DNA_END=932 /DNA_ORIENTATION=-